MTTKLIRSLTAFAISSMIVQSVPAQDASGQAFAMITALKQQQSEISENQTKLDEKIADISERIRVARLFMSRGGGKHKSLAPTK